MRELVRVREFSLSLLFCRGGMMKNISHIYFSYGNFFNYYTKKKNNNCAI